jgi:hypothetical protein
MYSTWTWQEVSCEVQPSIIRIKLYAWHADWMMMCQVDPTCQVHLLPPSPHPLSPISLYPMGEKMLPAAACSFCT